MKKLIIALTALFITTNAQAATYADPENTLLLQLKDGTVVIQLMPEKAPKTVARFKELVRKGFYNGLTFHRVIEGFMAQGGDPDGNGTGGSGQKLADEISLDTAYSRGILAMANSGPNTSDSQFFIMLLDYPLPSNYTIFGKVIKGMEFVDKIKKGDKDNNGTVLNPDKIISIKVAADVK